MMSEYYALEPVDNNYLEPEAVLKVVIQNFDHYYLDEETAKREAAERLVFLKEMNAAPELITLYENAKPIKCTIYNSDKSAHFGFDLSQNQGLLLLPDCETIDKSGLKESVQVLADKTGYKLTAVSE